MAGEVRTVFSATVDATISQRIARIGWSLRRLSRHSGIDAATLSRLVRGLERPRPETEARIGAALVRAERACGLLPFGVKCRFGFAGGCTGELTEARCQERWCRYRVVHCVAHRLAFNGAMGGHAKMHRDREQGGRAQSQRERTVRRPTSATLNDGDQRGYQRCRAEGCDYLAKDDRDAGQHAREAHGWFVAVAL